jgi:ketosteroid isomerase-like protein
MKPVTHRQDLFDYYAAFSRSDFDAMRAYMHPDCVLDFPGSSFGGTTRGREAILDLFRGIQHIMNGTLTFHCRWGVVDGDMAAVHWFTSGKPVHGGDYMNRGVAWFRLEDGLMIEFQDFLDTEIVAAFFPGGAPATDLTQAGRLVEKLSAIRRL